MATPTEPITGALFRALRTTADPELARAAEEEIRQIASQNVIAVLGAKIDILAAKIDSQGAEIRAEIKSQTARIDVLQAGDLACDLAAHRFAGRSHFRAALQGSHWLGGTQVMNLINQINGFLAKSIRFAQCRSGGRASSVRASARSGLGPPIHRAG